MDSAYLFLLAAVVFGGLFGAHVQGPRWVPAALCSAAPVVTLITLYSKQSTHGLLETVAAASPLLIAMALVYFALGYIGAAFGNRYRSSLSETPTSDSEKMKGKSISNPCLPRNSHQFLGTTDLGIRSKWPVYLALFIAFPVIWSFLASTGPAITSAWQRIFP